MKKTSLGIPCGVMAAVMYIVCLYSGALGTLLTAGYILLKEKDEWLKNQAVKAVLLMLVFGVASIVLGLIPDTISLLSSLLNVFGGTLSIPVVSNVVYFADNMIGYAKVIIFLMLAYKSLSCRDVKVPFVDKIVNKIASGEATEFSDLTNDMQEDFEAVKEKIGETTAGISGAAAKAKESLQEKKRE